jgi:hypothetical protein
LHIRDKNLLLRIKFFFNGIGNIHIIKNKSAIYKVQDINEIINTIIPHFDKYPLITEKQNDFKLFKSILEIIKKKEHLNITGLYKILSLKASLN